MAGAEKKLHVLSRGKVYKAVYFPGGTLDFEISILCTDDSTVQAPRHEAPTRPYAGNHVEALFNHSASNAPKGPAVTVRAACVKAVGMCLADSTWVNDINGFSDPHDTGVAGGAGPARGAAAVEEAGAAAQQQEGWSVWSWFKQPETKPGGNVDWVDGLPQPVVPKQNYQTVLATDTQEFLPRGTPLRCGDMRTFTFSLHGLPSELPPSYNGYALRYCYYVWCCVVSEAADGTAKEHVLKLPFQVWNHTASLRPIRPTPPGDVVACAWRVRELSRTRQSEQSRRAALLSFSEAARPRELEELEEADRDELPTIISPTASEMGDILGTPPPNALPPLEDPDPESSAHHHLSSARAIEQLLSLPHKHETLIRHKDTPFLRVITHGIHNHVGGSVRGVLSAIDNDVCTCARISMRLEHDERIPCALFKSGTFIPSPARTYPQMQGDREEFAQTRLVQSKVVEEVNEVMLGCEESSFDFSLSPTYPATIYTDKVAVEWNLTFTFFFVLNERRTEYLKTGEVACEYPIAWQLPLQVHVPPGVTANCKPNRFVYSA
eukprot:TRINITY_DN7625_c0_g1_i1.p1 TRINITY_DN7625_c0_g1~~TRINITY_DN7625_c0_g1_i1.p1  ORF type:complete len:550 (+),score=148.38 TRINITY_DN7625_c0_g1_i1:107-1756(+)